MGFKKAEFNIKFKDGRTLKVHYCVDCEKEISYRATRCRSCDNKTRIVSEITKKKLSLKLKLLRPKIPFPKCLECEKTLTRRDSLYCKTHASKHRKHRKQKPKKKYYCQDCGVKISYNSGCYGQGRCLRCANLGRRNPSYIDGRTPLIMMIRNLEEYKQWRIEVFKRDNHTCQECGQYNGKLEVHHKKTLTKILVKFLKIYDQFSPLEDKETLARLAIKYKPFWDITNGKTLCKLCHNIIELNLRKIEL